MKPKKDALSSCPRKRAPATHFKQEHKKVKKLQTRVVPLTPLSEAPVTAEDEYQISVASGTYIVMHDACILCVLV